MLIDLVSPHPLAMNTYWRCRGSTYFISEKRKRHHRTMALIVRQQRLKLSLSGRLAVKVTVELPGKRRRDLDNILKAPLDVLTCVRVSMDSEQFDEVNTVHGQPASGGCMRVKIYPIMYKEQAKERNWKIYRNTTPQSPPV